MKGFEHARVGVVWEPIDIDVERAVVRRLEDRWQNCGDEQECQVLGCGEAGCHPKKHEDGFVTP